MPIVRSGDHLFFLPLSIVYTRYSKMAEALQDIKDTLQLLRSLQHELKIICQDTAVLHHATLVASATCDGACSFLQVRLQAYANKVRSRYQT